METTNMSKQQASFCQKNKRILSHFYKSKEEFLKEYRKVHGKEAKAEFYLLVFNELEKAVSENDIDSLKKLINIISYANEIEDRVNLKNYYNNDRNPIRNTNLVILACKQNKQEILEYLFSNGNKLLHNLSLNIEKNIILPGNEDEECHNAFYYAIRSGNIELLDTLINKWSGNYFTFHLEELDEILSKAYEELNLRNVLLSNEMEFFVQSKLIDLRFFSKDSKQDKSLKINLNDIKERIELILQNISLLTTKHSDTKKVDEKFLFTIRFIAQNIHILKQQLKSTYDRLPWEEMEFCLISFFSAHTKRQEINLFYHGILNKWRILNHLENFRKTLEDEMSNIEMIDINKITELPKRKREIIVEEIINNYPQFEELYNDYVQVRDIYTLGKLDNCIKLAVSVDPKKKEGQLVITGVLQVTGEYLKNTLESPKLSDTTSKLFLLSLPSNTREIIKGLRNSLSHAHSLSKRTKIEENMDVNFFIGIQNDIKKVNNVVTSILYNNRIKMIKILFKRIDNVKGVDEMHEIATVFSTIELKFKTENSEMIGHKQLEELIEKLNNSMTEKTDYQRQLFDKINDIIKVTKTTSENITFDYINGFLILWGFCSVCSGHKIDDNVIRSIKFFTNKVLENIAPPIEPHNFKDIAELVTKVFRTVNFEKSDNCDQIFRLLYQIMHIVAFEVNDIKWIRKLRETLNKKDSFAPKRKQTEVYDLTEKVYDNQLAQKLSELKAILQSNALSDRLIKTSAYERDTKLQAVIKMLVLDVMSILSSRKNCLVNNLHYLDDNSPVLTGKCLRNHLAHDNALVEILLSNPSISVILNARKLTEGNILGNTKRIGQFVKDDPSKLKGKYDRCLIVIANQQRMFAACENGDLESLKESFRTGADIRARNVNLWTTLHFAAKGSSLDVVKFIVDRGLDPNVRNVNRESPLHIAAAHGRAVIVKFFIEETDLRIDEIDGNHRTPLYIAAQYGHKDTVEILLKNNADTNTKDLLGFSPLHAAIRNNYIDVAKILLDRETDVDVHEATSGFTPLHIAAENGHLEIVNFLLRNGADVNATNDKGGIPMHTAALNGHLEAVRAMILKGGNVNARTISGCTPLHFAVETGREELANVLLQHGADPNIFDKTYRNTPLHYAAKDGHVGIVKALLRHKADANVATAEGITPLHFAVLDGCLEIIGVLLEHGVKVHAKNNMQGFTALHLAADKGHKEIVEFLIRNGAEVNARDNSNYTPLHAAASHGYKDIVDLLIKNKAEVNIRDNEGNTPLLMAARKGKKDLIELLIENKAEVSVKNITGATPLHSAAVNDDPNVIDILIENKAEVNAISLGLTPLHLATVHGQKDVIDRLIKNGAEVNSKGIHGVTPLQSAITAGRKDVVQLLINNEAQVNGVNGNNLLSLAIETGNIDIIEILIRNGADVDGKDKYGKVPLVSAVFKNNKEIVNILIANGANVNAENGEPLMKAAFNGCTDIVKILLQNKACVNLKFFKNYTPLHVAAQAGHTDIVELLLSKGVEIDATNISGLPPLFLAVQASNKEVVELLLSNGANANAEFMRTTALHLAVGLHGDVDIVKVLLDHGSDISIKDEKNRTPLQLAAANNYPECVKALLSRSKKTDINDKGNDGWTVLHIAAQVGNLEMVRYLTDEGSDVHARNDSGSKPVHIAAREGSKDVVEFLLDKGCDVRELGASGQTLLHYAAMKGRLEVVRYLMSKGVDVNARDLLGMTPMHLAANFGHKNVIEALLENGTIYNSLDSLFRKPSDMASAEDITIRLASTEKLFEAIKRNDVSKVEGCVRTGAFVNATHATRKGCDGTALHYAAWKGYDDIVRVLLRNKADPNVIGNKGLTPLHYAAKYSHLTVVLVLLSNGAVYEAVSDCGKTPSDFAVDTSIASLFKSVRESFRNVARGDPRVIGDLRQINDLDTIKAIMNARNREKQTLIVVAIRNHFPKVDQLKEISQGDVSLQTDAASMYCIRGNYQMALNIYKALWERRKGILGPDNPATLDIQTDVAKMLYKLGAYQEALNMSEEILRKRMDVLGPDDKDILHVKDLIALIYYRQNRNKEAFDIYEEIIQKQKEILGPDHPDILNSQFHMALVLNNLQRYDEALTINETVFEKRRKIYGPNHPHTIAAQNNIAMVLASQHSNEEALKIYREVYEKKKIILGVYHTDTLRTYHNIIGILEKQKKYKEAMKAYEDIWDIQKRVLGPFNPETLNTQYNFGMMLFTQGKFISAVKIFSEGFDQRKAVLGAHSSSVLGITGILEVINLKLKSEGSSMSELIGHLQREINIAANDGDVQTVRRLLENGADPNDKDIEGRTPLHFAVGNGHVDVANVLLRRGADVTRATVKGNTPLHTAVSKGHVEIVEVLLQHASRDVLPDFVNAGTTTTGTAPLHVAAMNGSLAIVRTLLGHGAIYDLANKHDKTPLDLSTSQAVNDLLGLVGKLFEDASTGNVKIVDKLGAVEHDEFTALTNARDRRGLTLLQVAIFSKKKDVASKLAELIRSRHRTVNSC